MDEETKLSAKQLFSLLSLLKSGKDGAADPGAILKAHLNEEQQKTAREILQDPQRLQALLNQPQIRTLLERLQQAQPHGPDGV